MAVNGFIFVGFDYGDKLLFSDEFKKRQSFAFLKKFGVSISEYQSLFSLFLWKNNSNLWQISQRKVESLQFQFGGHVDKKFGI